ncbi:MAG: DNA translocase FtsK [Dehalococcoidales bacterium]|nr:DNA translocase FtsK [Dehalococcoidales bacterium]
MAKKGRGSGGKGRGKSHWDWLFYGALLLLAALAVWAIIQYDVWSEVTTWFTDVASNIWETVGWGLLLIALAIVTLIVLIRLKKVLSLFRHGMTWLGAIALVFAAWGILAFFDAGGTFGMGIIGDKNFAGAMIIFAFLLMSVLLIKPLWVVYFVKLVVRSIINARIRARQRAAMKPIVYKKVPIPPGDTNLVKPLEAETSSPKESKTAAKEKETPSAPAQKGLRQIAQDVWKKYGQSSAAKEVDGWKLPPIDILDDITEKEAGQADNVQRARKIEEALKSYGVEAKVVQINAGPTVTQFGVEPGWDIRTREVKERDKEGSIQTRLEEISRTRVKVDRITSLGNDLALALAASSIRIEAPVPGKAIIGIEVPNTISSAVSLRGVIETTVFQKLATKSKLSVALGKGAGGEAGAADLAKMPHLLIAGATGSGKTVCLNAIIACLLMQNTPDELRFIMIDPKRVELTPYNSIPQLAVPVIVNAEKAIEALRWLNQEMDNRYQQLARAGVRNIEGYNKNRTGKDKMPYLILVIDELADLMMAGFDEVEHILCRLAQLARAIGIHLIVATQRPSVDVVTGLIKANFPTRLSFAVTSQVDSRTILDSVGAEKLLGKGDMLYMPTDAAKPKRLQGCFVADAEIERLVYFWSSQQVEEVAPLKIEALPASSISVTHEPPRDALLIEARKIAEEHGGQISTSFLQRRLQIGYPRAARLKELLDEELAKEGKQNPPPPLSHEEPPAQQ